MVTQLALRLVTVAAGHGYEGALLVAAAAESGDQTGLVKAAIITGIFTTVGALIAAATVLLRARNPDLSELLEMHDRVTTVEYNLADIKRQLDRIEEKQGGHHER